MQEGRFNLMQIMHSAKLETNKLSQLIEALDAADGQLKLQSNDPTKFANYMAEKEVTVTELVDASYHSTICRNCNVVCHNQCGLQEISAAGDNAFLRCSAFDGSNGCKKCK